MTVRAKFQLSSVTSHAWGTAKTLKFQANYDPSIPEDISFNKASPSGSMEIMVDNPKALEQLEVGKYYYLDLTPVQS